MRRTLFAVVLAVSIAWCGSLACGLLFDEEPPSVTTNDATGVTGNSATLNGNLTSLGTSRKFTVFFWWGTSSVSYPNDDEANPYTHETTPESRTATGGFSFEITGLSPNTTYYFRAVAEGGISYGDEKSFTTSAVGG